jgi:arsenite methyltransferase
MARRKAQDAEVIRKKVREGYGKIATTGSSCGCKSSSCCGGADAGRIAKAVGYSDAELAALPAGANMGLSCGNPTAIASLKAGEAVLDLGSGGGFDVFIAGRKVGRRGRAIGVDMTPEMLSKARANALIYEERTGLKNVEFRLGEIEHLPVADSSVDVVISNCVINLCPDKPQVWREIARVLKPGGRVAVSDMALLKPLPPKVADMVEALVGCVAGAPLVKDTKRNMTKAGLTQITLSPKVDYLKAADLSSDPIFAKMRAALPKGAQASDYVTSMNIEARKPR